MNQEAVNYLRAALVGVQYYLSSFDRTNFTRICLGYQITQQRQPLAIGGRVRLPGIVDIKSAFEEDAAAGSHGRGHLIDYNRSGMALVPSLPLAFSPGAAVFSAISAPGAVAGISDCKLEEGSLRCDANISCRAED